ncbi:MAG: hypothetical protein ACLU8D_07430 [Enterocloster sp.]
MLGLVSVKEALAFIEANQPEAIEEQKELVLIEAPRPLRKTAPRYSLRNSRRWGWRTSTQTGAAM